MTRAHETAELVAVRRLAHGRRRIHADRSGAGPERDRPEVPQGLRRARHRLLADRLRRHHALDEAERRTRARDDAQVTGGLAAVDHDARRVAADVDDGEGRTRLGNHEWLPRDCLAKVASRS
jgi:hypothetical protein